ncbi:MAG TPA: S8 family serine peptidase [Tepidisphaeraceae bacterium]|nr:S8 family serine peptidase [Tepidisphaeraceae bacterium]
MRQYSLPKFKSKRTRVNASCRQALEGLESRLLLASARDIFNVGQIPDTPPTSTVLTDTKNGPMANTSQDLITLYLDYRRFRNAGGVDANYVPGATVSNALSISKAKVTINVRGRGTLTELTDYIRSVGGQILYRNGSFVSIDAIIPIGQLHSMAVAPTVATLNSILSPLFHQAGSADNQADEAELADLVRSTYGLDGTGLKIGVISDSVNLVGNGVAGSVATGDLPSDGVQIVSDLSQLDQFLTGGGTDEGRAMLELIHDIAPGAQLAFATAGISQQVMANNIHALRAAGCDIIIDDVAFMNEPFFQPGVIDQAISDVVADGAIYLTAAGNNGAQGFEIPTTFTTIGASQFLDFDTRTSVDTKMKVDTSASGPLLIQWDNPYNGIAGNVSTDLDVYIFDANHPTRLIASATSNNIRTGIPEEVVNVPAGSFLIQVQVADRISGKALPTRFRMVLANNNATSSNNFFPYDPGTFSSIFGHNGSPYAISVGAVAFFNAPPFSDAIPIISEASSSVGTTTQIFDSSGNRLPAPAILQRPDISGIDGSNNTVVGIDDENDPDVVFPNFFGTSAAAPNVGAVVALLLQAAPGSTQQQILDALKSTATPLNGTGAGVYDTQGGFGLVNALAAVEKFVAAPTVQILPLAANPAVGSVKQITVKFSQQVTGFTSSDIILSFEGGPNLITGTNKPISNDGGQTWIIPNLSGITSTPGSYELQINNDDGLIQNASGTPLETSASLDFSVVATPGIPAVPAAVALKVLSETSVRIRWTEASSFASGYVVQRADDANFTTRVKTINITSNTLVATDTDPTITGKRVYYRVRAYNAFGQTSAYSAAAFITMPSPGEVVLDNDSVTGVTISGTWQTLSAGTGFLNGNYLDDLNANKGSDSVRYTPTISKEGDYYVYARWVRSANNATNTPIDIFSAGGKKTITVNQRTTGGGGWVLLGKFHFKAGTLGSVLIRNSGTNGHVVADGVRFLSATGT